jgi:hypothetical protein
MYPSSFLFLSFVLLGFSLRSREAERRKERGKMIFSLSGPSRVLLEE